MRFHHMTMVPDLVFGAQKHMGFHIVVKLLNTNYFFSNISTRSLRRWISFINMLIKVVYSTL